MGSERIYIVYQDYDGGRSQHVVAKNRKEAWTKVDFRATHVAWRPWLKLENGMAVDEHGKSHGEVAVTKRPAPLESSSEGVKTISWFGGKNAT